MNLADISGYGQCAKNPVVVEIGLCWTKIGIAGEFAPRTIIRTNKILEEPTDDPIFSISDDFHLEWDEMDLRKFFSYIYYKALCLNFMSAGCTIVYSDLWSDDLRHSIERSLLKSRVPFVSFLPSQLCAIYALNLDTALIIDIGHRECHASVLVSCPINTILINFMNQNPCYKLMAMAYRQQFPLFAGDVLSYGVEDILQRIENELNAKVDRRMVEMLLATCCFVTSKSRSEQYQSRERIDDSVSDFLHRIDKSRMIRISAKTRETACDVIFEPGHELRPIGEVVCDLIDQCPIDLRVPLLNNIVLTGGGADIKGMFGRFEEEIRVQAQFRRWPEKLLNSINVCRTGIPGIYVNWTGASLIASTDAIDPHPARKNGHLLKDRNLEKNYLGKKFTL